MSKQRAIQCFGSTDVGRVRTQNQDHYLIADLHRLLTISDTSIPHEDCDHLFGRTSGLILAVADGMGGHAGGERASTLAVESMSKYVLNMMNWFLKLSPQHEDDFVDELKAGLTQVQNVFDEEAQVFPGKSTMGTTLTLAYVIGQRMYVVHVGDSRCYLLRDGELTQITTDHTLAQQLLDRGLIDDNDERISRFSHVLWNCIGGGTSDISPEVIRVTLQSDDYVVVCSDGLTGPVTDEQIAGILAQPEQTPEQLTATLIQTANAAGGPDNITAVVAHVQFVDDPSVANRDVSEDLSLADTQIMT